MNKNDTISQQAYEGGKAFGKFQAMLSDLYAKILIETIAASAPRAIYLIPDRELKLNANLTPNP